MKTVGRGLLSAAIFVSVGVAQAQQAVRVAYVPFNIPIVYAAGATATNYRTLDPDADLARGALVDLLKAMAKDAGLRLQFVPIVAGEQLEALRAGRIDLATTAPVHTPEIDAAIAFSAPTYVFTEGLVVKKSDMREYKHYQDLRGETVGVLKGSAASAGVEKAGIFAAVRQYDSGAELERAVADGQVKAGFASSVYGALLRQKENPSAGWKIALSYQPAWLIEARMAARKADGAMLKKLDASLAKLKADGTAIAIFAKYGVEGALAN